MNNDGARHHIHEELFSVSPERMFITLLTPSAIKEWWGASRAIVVPKKGGSWVAMWGEDEKDSDCISTFRISEFDPPNRLIFTDGRFLAKAGQAPFEMNMTTEFIIEPMAGGCMLRVVHDGFPTDKAADEFYEACVLGWMNSFEGIRKYLFDNPVESDDGSEHRLG